MSTLQLLGVLLLAVMLFGSFALGRYFRHKDYQRDNAIVIQHIHREKKSETGPNFIYTAGDLEHLRQYLADYHAEVERIASGYHQRLMLEGEEAAQLWLDQQTGHRPKSIGREGR